MDSFNLLGQVATRNVLHMEVQHVENGDILTCPDRCCAELVMGSSLEGDTCRLLVVKEGEMWEQRDALRFQVGRVVFVARRNA